MRSIPPNIYGAPLGAMPPRISRESWRSRWRACVGSWASTGVVAWIRSKIRATCSTVRTRRFEPRDKHLSWSRGSIFYNLKKPHEAGGGVGRFRFVEFGAVFCLSRLARQDSWSLGAETRRDRRDGLRVARARRVRRPRARVPGHERRLEPLSVHHGGPKGRPRRLIGGLPAGRDLVVHRARKSKDMGDPSCLQPLRRCGRRDPERPTANRRRARGPRSRAGAGVGVGSGYLDGAMAPRYLLQARSRWKESVL